MRNVKLWFLCFFKASSSVFKLSTSSKKELFMSSFCPPTKDIPSLPLGNQPLFLCDWSQVSLHTLPPFLCFNSILQEQQICFTSKCQRFFHNCIQCQQKTQTPYSHCMIIVNLCIGMLTEIWVFPRQQELAQLNSNDLFIRVTGNKSQGGDFFCVFFMSRYLPIFTILSWVLEIQSLMKTRTTSI